LGAICFAASRGPLAPAGLRTIDEPEPLRGGATRPG